MLNHLFLLDNLSSFFGRDSFKQDIFLQIITILGSLIIAFISYRSILKQNRLNNKEHMDFIKFEMIVKFRKENYEELKSKLLTYQNCINSYYATVTKGDFTLMILELSKLNESGSSLRLQLINDSELEIKIRKESSVVEHLFKELTKIFADSKYTSSKEKFNEEFRKQMEFINSCIEDFNNSINSYLKIENKEIQSLLILGTKKD